MASGSSERKIQANRFNALRSTGPRTPAGKARARWNALRHGLLAQEVVIPAGRAQEDEGAFRDLFTRLCDELQPQGVLESMCVERIAIRYWRLRRALRYEVGDIRRQVDSQDEEVFFAAPAEVEIAGRSLPSKEGVEKLHRYETAIRRDLDHAIAELQRLQEQRRQQREADADTAA